MNGILHVFLLASEDMKPATDMTLLRRRTPKDKMKLF